MLPGIPQPNSSPESPRSTQKLVIWECETPDSARSRPPGRSSSLRQPIHPDHDAFEAAAEHQRVEAGAEHRVRSRWALHTARSCAISSRVAGVATASAGPPTRSEV